VREAAMALAFKMGRAFDRTESDWGHDQSAYVDTKYAQYLTLSTAVYACANVRAKNLAKLPLKLYKLGRNGAQREVTRGRLAKLLNKVNPFWTWGRLIRMTELSLCAWGQCYWVLERGADGVPVEIWWARADQMRPVVDPVKYVRGFIYEAGGEKIGFPVEDVIWFRYENPNDEFSPLSPIAPARLSIDTTFAALKSNRSIFTNGMNTAGFLHPADQKDKMTKPQVEELQELLEHRLKGEDKAHRIAVLSHAAKFESVTISPKDAEFLGLLAAGIEDVCRVYDVPPPFIQHFARATWANIRESHRGLWQNCLLPEGAMIAEEITEQLLPNFPGEADIVRFDESAVLILQEDRGELVQQMYKMWTMGVPLNNLLAKYEPSLLPPGGYAWGDTFWAPLNLVPAGEALAPGMPGDDGEDPAAPAQQALKLIQQARIVRERQDLVSGFLTQNAPALEDVGAGV
jgi:HK97 family phage portal protein